MEAAAIEGHASSLRKGLSGEAEDRMDELTLTDRDRPWQPSGSGVSELVHRLVTFDRPACAVRRTEAEARSDPLFDEAMIVLDDVV